MIYLNLLAFLLSPSLFLCVYAFVLAAFVGFFWVIAARSLNRKRKAERRPEERWHQSRENPQVCYTDGFLEEQQAKRDRELKKAKERAKAQDHLKDKPK